VTVMVLPRARNAAVRDTAKSLAATLAATVASSRYRWLLMMVLTSFPFAHRLRSLPM
jgi:hypothetical protein